MSDLVTSADVLTLLSSPTLANFRLSLDVYSKSDVDNEILNAPYVGTSGVQAINGNLTVTGLTSVSLAVETITGSAGSNPKINNVEFGAVGEVTGAMSISSGLFIATSSSDPGLVANSLTEIALLLSKTNLTVATGSLAYDSDRNVILFYDGSNYRSSGRTTVSKTADFTVDERIDDKKVFLIDSTTGDVDITLPDPADCIDIEITFKRVDSSVNAVTIIGTVDGAASPTLANQYDYITVISDGSTFHTIGTNF